MSLDAWITVGVVALVMGLLAATRVTPYLILLGGLVLLLTVGVIGEADLLSGLSNPGMVTVGVLFVVVSGLRETGAMSWVAEPLLGHMRAALRVGATRDQVAGAVAVVPNALGEQRKTEARALLERL